MSERYLSQIEILAGVGTKIDKFKSSIAGLSDEEIVNLKKILENPPSYPRRTRDIYQEKLSALEDFELGKTENSQVKINDPEVARRFTVPHFLQELLGIHIMDLSRKINFLENSLSTYFSDLDCFAYSELRQLYNILSEIATQTKNDFHYGESIVAQHAVTLFEQYKSNIDKKLKEIELNANNKRDQNNNTGSRRNHNPDKRVNRWF